MKTKIKNGLVITPMGIVQRNVYFKDGTITDITDQSLDCEQEYDAQGRYVSPGFIDVHTHGGGGADFMDGGVDCIVTAACLHLRHGTTSILPTTLAAGVEATLARIGDIGTAMRMEREEPTGRWPFGVQRLPHILGAHLEGPYFSVRQSGAQNPAFLKAPCPEEYNRILSEGKGVIRRWSFAPELKGSGAFCCALLQQGVIPAIAHSDGEYEDVKRVYDLGCKLAVHLYSGMSTIVRKNGFRHLGVVESALLLQDMDVEVIADGMHLPPELLRLIYQCKGPEHILLVTDAMRGAGMPEGKSYLGKLGEGMECIVEDGVAKLPDRTAFAGSVATSDRLVRTMAAQAKIPLLDAVRMMTDVPARVMGLTAKGKLEAGYDADIVLFDEDIRIGQVWVSGQAVL